MATSGTLTGSRGNGNSTAPWLTLDWTRVDIDEVNNKSQLTLTLKLRSDSSLYFSASKTGSLDGTSFTYTGGFSGTGAVTVKTVTKWFNHNSDGSLTVNIDGSLNIAVSWGSGTISSLSVSGNITVDTIPRASDFTAFSLTNATLNTNTAVTVNYTLSRKSTAFSQDMTLKYGSTVIKSWNTASTGALTQALSTTEVNNIIKAMSSVTSGTLTLTMQTKSGSTNIGSLASRTLTVTLNSAIVPTATGLSVSIYGTGRDKTINQYVQTISKVTASFTDTAGYGATIKSTVITVKRKSDSGDSQTISGDNGTTANAVKLAGTYTVTGTVTDSRNRTASVSVDITVVAYAPPTITTFSTVRDTALTTNVKATLNLSWYQLGTSNPATITVVGKDNTGATSTLYSLAGSTAGIINTTQTYSSQSDASAYTYTLTITDSFGKIGTATGKVSTSFVEITISKGWGISVGKVWEHGALDVKGDSYFDGTIRVAKGNSGFANGDLGTGIWANNTDIRGINILAFNDMCETNEGVYFLRSKKSDGTTVTVANSSDVTDYDIFRALDNGLYFHQGGNSTSDPFIASWGRFNANVSGAAMRLYNQGSANAQYIEWREGGWDVAGTSSTRRLYMGFASNGSPHFSIKNENTTPGQIVLIGGGASLEVSHTANAYFKDAARSAYIPVNASAFTVNSQREMKHDIEDYTTDALAQILQTPIRQYHYKGDLDYEPKRVGVILDESPVDIVDIRGEGVETYAMTTMSWKAIQQLYAKIAELESEVILLKGA